MGQRRYLEAAARKLQASCPSQARYLLWTYSLSDDTKNTSEETCPHCFQLLMLDNSRVRLKPKLKMTPQIQRLLNREAKGYTLTFKEAKLVKKYRDSSSVLLVTCKTCNRTVKHCGKSRRFLSSTSNPSTPQSSLKTPQRKTPSSANSNHERFSSTGKSPSLIFRTPMSGQSTPASRQSTPTFSSSSSSKSMSKRKKQVSQLKLLLSQQESQKSPRMDFRNFLSSL
ncbi:PREDICTED: UPF0711 protein C18orf21 homolog [Elephantulus edwardii]|uniref:UPF0711 protein C18orf21 homolog n=1 Tax=Elephantulus edwardii TaxID=28737 RepID=UPI0003F0BE6E|nr:PREDICTED: UPF0711 protein C18orf21 homolog [Elephantulus edwardii]